MASVRDARRQIDTSRVSIYEGGTAYMKLHKHKIYNQKSKRYNRNSLFDKSVSPPS